MSGKNIGGLAARGDGGALVIIDPQNDFCDRRGSLYVDGAEDDMRRLASHISRSGGRYSGVFVSLDSHDAAAIFHPSFWRGEDGASPGPFTAITEADYRSGRWSASRPGDAPVVERMFAAMARKNIPSLTVWPEHCLVSTWGHGITGDLAGALADWRRASGRPVRYVFKGENPYTEQFSIFEGLDETWPDAAFNVRLLDALAGFDFVMFAGEALSHCVEASLASYVGRGGAAVAAQGKFLLRDCTSPVGGFDRAECEGRVAALGVTLVASDE